MPFTVKSDQGMGIAGPIINPYRFNNTYDKTQSKLLLKCPTVGSDQQINAPPPQLKLKSSQKSVQAGEHPLGDE